MSELDEWEECEEGTPGCEEVGSFIHQYRLVIVRTCFTIFICIG
jgi:hypothetical protein